MGWANLLKHQRTSKCYENDCRYLLTTEIIGQFDMGVQTTYRLIKTDQVGRRKRQQKQINHQPAERVLMTLLVLDPLVLNKLIELV